MIRKKIALVCLVFALIPISAAALTLAEIRAAVRLIVKDSDANRQRYSNANLDAIINAGQREASGASYAIVKSEEIALALSTTFYAMPTDAIAIRRVTLDNTYLQEASPEGLDSDPGARWIEQKGRPSRYFHEPSEPGSIGVSPIPSSGNHLGTLRVFYYAFADDLSADGDEPFNAIARYAIYHDILTFYAAYRLLLIEGQVDKAGAYSGLYETRLMALINRANEQPNYRPSFGGSR